MQKYLLLGLGVVVIVILGFYLFSTDTVTYVAEINTEIDELEAELMELEAAVADGSITPEEALEAQVKIVARLETINNKANTAGSASLSASQKLMLESGLERLKGILTTYQGTLVSVDEVADTAPAAVKARLNPRGSDSITRAVAVTIEILEEHADEVIEDFIPEEGLSDEIIDEETGAEELDTEEEGDEVVSEEEAADTDSEVEVETETTIESNEAGDDSISETIEAEADVTTDEEDPTAN